MQGVKVLEFLQDNTKNKPNEDFLQVLESDDYLVCAVADGVTRYVPEGASYPNPSLAREAAEVFCREAISHISSASARGKMYDFLKSAFTLGNNAVYRLNYNMGITSGAVNYLANDYYGCQGVVGFLDCQSFLHYGHVGDCGLLVFDNDLFPMFLSENPLSNLEQFREGWGFSSKDERKKFWTKTMRNNPSARHLTYGSLTGQPEALSYVKTGVLYLEPGDTVIFFSDGILPFIFERTFREMIRDQKYVRNCIDFLTKKLAAKHVSNLDDDKAFVAFSV